MPRYDFVNPYVGRSGWEDAAGTLNDVLDSERRRRAEIESKRRFEEQMGVQKGYLANTQTRTKQQGITEGFGDPDDPYNWNEDESAGARQQRRGADLQHGTMKFGQGIRIEDEERGRGYDAEDRERTSGYFRGMGFGPDKAGALTEALPAYQFTHPQELEPESQEWWKTREDIQHRNRLGEIGAMNTRRAGSGGRSQQLIDLDRYLDNQIGAIRLREGQRPTRPVGEEADLNTEFRGFPTAAAENAFLSESTEFDKELSGMREGFTRGQRQYGGILEQEYELPAGSLTGNKVGRSGVAEEDLQRALQDQEFFNFLVQQGGVDLRLLNEDMLELKRRTGARAPGDKSYPGQRVNPR